MRGRLRKLGHGSGELRTLMPIAAEEGKKQQSRHEAVFPHCGENRFLAKHVAKVMLVRSQPSPARGACGTPIAAFCALTRACSYPAAAGRLCCDGQVLTRAGKLSQVVQGVGL